MTGQIINFDDSRAARCIEDCFAGYLKDPADSEYQRAYLAALLDLYREGLGRGVHDDRLALLDAQVRS